MRTYKAKIKLSEPMIKLNTGDIGEKVFKYWFNNNFQGEQIFKQKADRDYEKIDFADEKGYTYQVKATRGNTYTFNCHLDHLREHLKSDVYVFIQIDENVAYIEDFYSRDYIEKNIKKSYKFENSFVWAKNLQQNQLSL
jgi:hypothetical protein